EGGGRACAGIAGALHREATAAEGQSRQECSGEAVGAQVPRLQLHDAQGSPVESCAGIAAAAEGADTGDLPSGARPLTAPCHRCTRSAHPGLGGVLPTERGERLLRGAGWLAAAQAASVALAAVEASAYAGSEAAPAGARRGSRLRVGLQWPRSVVERGRQPYALGIACSCVPPSGARELP